MLSRWPETQAVIDDEAKLAAVLKSAWRDGAPKWVRVPDEPAAEFQRLAITARNETDTAIRQVIPPEHRTKPMSYRQAARYLGRPDSQDSAEWLKKCVDDGTVHCDPMSRQSHVFDRRQFPATIWPQIMPKGNST